MSDVVRGAVVVVGLVVVVAGALAALAAAWEVVHRLAVRSIGARFVARQQIASLAAGVRPEYFDGVLGPPAMERTIGPETEFVYVSPYFYVVTIVRDRTVVAYFVTLRRRLRVRVAPALHPRRFRSGYRLGRVRFAEFGSPDALTGWVGARRSGYLESHYVGGPGYYQRYFVGLNDAGVDHDAGLLGALFDVGSPYRAGDASTWGAASADRRAELLADPLLARFRATSRPNTYGVTAPFEDLGELGAFGVDADRVRALP